MDVVIETGESLITGLISTLISNSITFAKKQNEIAKKQNYLAKLEEEEENFIEKELLSFAEVKIKIFPNFFNEILSNYNISKSLFNELDFDSLTKSIIEEKIKKVNYTKDLSHLNILLLGKDQRGKISIINSILGKNTPEGNSNEYN